MADNENVNINVRVDADLSDLNKTQRRLAAFAAQAEAIDKRFGRLNNAFEKFNGYMGKAQQLTDKFGGKFGDLTDKIKNYNKAQDDANKKVRWWDRNVGKANRRMGKMARTLKGVFRMAMKLAAVETLGLLAALSSVNAMLAIGSGLSRAWASSVKALGVVAANAAASIAAAIALFTQAQRQFQAASASGSYGGSFAASSRALRSMRSDANLAMFGVEALSGAFASASRNAKVTGATVTSIRGLADFAVMSGDMEKGLAATAQIVSLLQSGKNAQGEQVLAAAKDIGPEFEKAYKEVLKSGKTTNAELLKMFASGDLAEAAGVAGTAQNVRGTLMGQIKSFITEFQNTFADFGQAFITPVQETFDRLQVIFRRTLLEISSNLYSFGTGNFVDAIIYAAEKISDFTVLLFNKYLPMTDQFIDNFTRKWRALTGWFSDGLERFRNGLRRFSEASREVNKFLGSVLGGIGRGLRDNFIDLADWVVKNSDKFQKFGRDLGDAFYDVLRVFQKIRMAFLEASPAIMTVVNAFMSFASVLGTVVQLLGQMLGFLGALGGPGSMIGGVAGLGGTLALMSGFSMIRGRGIGVGGRALKAGGRGVKGVGRAMGLKGGGAALATMGLYSLFDRGVNQEGPSYASLGSSVSKSLRNASLAGILPTLFYTGSNMAGNAAASMGLGAIPAPSAQGPTSSLKGFRGKGLKGMKGGVKRGITQGINQAAGKAMLGLTAATAVASLGMTLTGEMTNAIARNKNISNNGKLGMSAGTLSTVTGALGGAATGAATGALIGSMVFPGLGTAVGAGIGAVLGLVSGGVMGFLNAREARNDAKKSGRSFANAYADGVEDILRSGGLAQAKQAMHDFDRTLREFADNSAYSEITHEEAQKAFDERAERTQRHIDVMTANVDDLGRITGLADREIIDLARSLEIDLTGNMMDLQTQLEVTGVAVQRFGDAFNEAFNSVMAEAISQIDTALQIVSAPAVVNEAAVAFREVALSEAGATVQDAAELLRIVGEQTMMLSGGDPLAAYRSIIENIGSAAMPGRQFTTEGGVLYGLENEFFSPAMAPILSAFTDTARSGLQDVVTQNILQDFASRDMTASKEAVDAALSRMSQDNLIALAETYQAGGTLVPTDIDAMIGRSRFMSTEDRENAVTNFLNTAFEEATGSTIELAMSESAKTREKLAGAVKGGIIEGLGLKMDPLKEAIDLFNRNIGYLVTAVGGVMPDTSSGPNYDRGGDTFSPRRNLVDTMSRHRALDGMVSGSRSLTSSMRNFNLGSGMSDHAAGRAYDLVGQNLGLYATMVNNSGGYAAFHGAGGNRHLHVVPGSGAIGDTAVPRMKPVMAGGGSSSVSQDSITVNVYASDGMDETALANRVVEKIRTIQRNQSERY